MPISFAHPALVLPLRRLSKQLVSVSALVVGSMTPDLEYFYHLSPKRTYGHLWAHAWWFDGLLTIIVCFVFHRFVRNVLIDHLPAFLNQRFASYKHFNWTTHFRQYFPIVIISAIIGSYSHLLWDEFTHQGALFVEAFPILNQPLFEVFGREVFVYKVLQHLSSFLGTLAIIYVVLKLPGKKKGVANFEWYRYWLAVFGCSVIFLFATLFATNTSLAFSLNSFSKVGVTLLSGNLLGILLVSLYYQFIVR